MVRRKITASGRNLLADDGFKTSKSVEEVVPALSAIATNKKNYEEISTIPPLRTGAPPPLRNAHYYFVNFRGRSSSFMGLRHASDWMVVLVTPNWSLSSSPLRL